MENQPKKPWYKKWWVIALIVVGGLIVIGIFAPEPETSDTEQNQEQVKEEPKKEESTDTTAESEPQVIQNATISSKDPKTGEILLQEINVWQKAGSGGLDNVTEGSVPHGTRVEVLESKEAEGVIFYHIRSSVGKVSILPTDFNKRKKMMEEKPQEEWTVPADESFPVEGWVHQDFITNLE